MNKKHLVLAGRLQEELLEIEKIAERTRQGWQRAKKTGDEFYLDSVALNLHGIYTGLERMFELIANSIDQNKPEGKRWHQELLRQMAVEIPMVRPPVISLQTRDALDEYRSFRHVIRNIYTFNLNIANMERLVNNLPQIFAQLKSEVNKFIQFIELRNK
jgi:hypothetical protein